jgi:GT2 family glycosyltransferase
LARWELILVQEGEDEEITRLLNGYVIASQRETKFPELPLLPIKFVQNKTPKGFSGAMNTGLDLASKDSDFYCFLNNDTVATPGWMDAMMKVMENPEIGLVSPTYYGVASRQNPDWNNGREMEKVYDPLTMMGVCYLIRKEALEKVENPKGRWDEAFGLGGEEDYDMCIRIQNAGYSLAIARNAFIYHYVGASFKELFEGDIEKCRNHAKNNFQLLEKKHNIKIIPE